MLWLLQCSVASNHMQLSLRQPGGSDGAILLTLISMPRRKDAGVEKGNGKAKKAGKEDRKGGNQDKEAVETGNGKAGQAGKDGNGGNQDKKNDKNCMPLSWLLRGCIPSAWL
eukprot:365203-Chlamydomonas_euryale.AAC.5